MVEIQEFTTKTPITMIGLEAGVCYNSDIADEIKNYARGKNCIKTNHGRTLEFPDVYMILDGYSAKVIREFYTHIGGAPTRLQASTRYINYVKNGKPFDYVTPPAIAINDDAKAIYDDVMKVIAGAADKLQQIGIKKEDSSMMLPFAMTTKVVCKINLRTLIAMSRQRMCSRAFWEFHWLFNDIRLALINYSEEWASIVEWTFYPKCEEYGYCPEEHGCGAFPPFNAKGDRR